MDFYTAIGLLGVVTNLGAYGLLTFGFIHASDARYQIANIAGTSGILLSLFAEWNLASFLLNISWLTIAVLSLLHILRREAREKEE